MHDDLVDDRLGRLKPFGISLDRDVGQGVPVEGKSVFIDPDLRPEVVEADAKDAVFTFAGRLDTIKRGGQS
jgi:hypothetical protein